MRAEERPLPERQLTAAERESLAPYFQPATLECARIIEGRVPFWLSKRMCAVVLKHRIYFRPGAYSCGIPADLAQLELLAHELTHVEQYLSGMTIAKYLWASRRGYRQNPYEIEAYARAAAIRACVQNSVAK